MKLWHLASAFALLAEPFVLADLAYCATDNTGSDYDAVADTYQSNGACKTTCASYALGVLQGKKCWCTNIVPSSSSQKATSKCDTSCPGYPDDSCGSAADGVFAYVSVGSKKPTSTEGGSGGTTTTSTSSTSSTSTTGNIVKETTSGGQIKTITVAGSSSTAGADTSNTQASDEKSGLSGGSIAGIVIGVLGGLALLGGLIFLIFFYRKRARSASPIPSNADMADNRTSQGSSFVRGVFPQGSDGAGNGLGRQNTYTDNRMKNVYQGHASRDSSVSLQDNEDYSRPVLRLANPD
ncbi:Carbohydrate-binding WSC subgroup [Penicillium waksmanii]|uniref:Carbohydrate-binding WSC subgroup n=1 Tax=Penicillium waksmanii TaxID=69791 RepID=UPI0025479B72|nr:Carbohydrate-binding WSC subgroup [Penicillium waksmanii]KAJ5995045.1 Carbohydrate-binding WSC subgroup [Penicillium waksmanii]